MIWTTADIEATRLPEYIDQLRHATGQHVTRGIGSDHRFIDGYQAATMAHIFREYLGDPASFDPVPTPIAPRKRTPRPATARTRSALKPSPSGPVRLSTVALDRNGAKR